MYATSADCDLDKEYTPSKWTQRFRTLANYDEFLLANFLNVTKAHTDRAKAKYSVRSDVRYGAPDQIEGNNQLLDIYYKGTEKEGTPIFAYIHGGYWQFLDKSTAGSFVEPLLECGYRVLVADYNLCPTVSLEKLMEQIEQFIKWLLVYAEETQASDIVIAGHSAGANLTTTMLRNMDVLQQTVAQRIKSVFLISGVFDLRELYQLDCVNGNNILSLDVTNVEALSPICWRLPILSEVPGKWHLLVGAHESDTFIGHSREFYKKLKAAGLQVELKIMEGLDHFNIIEDVCIKGSSINRYILTNLK